MNPTLKDYESNERQLAAKLFSKIPTIKTWSFSSGRICYDTIISLKDGRQILGEIKVRDFEINKYDTYILEVTKLISLIYRFKQTKSDHIYYINFFNNKAEGVKDFIIFNLTPRIQQWKVAPPKIEQKWMNKTTYISKTDKVCKDVIMLEYYPNVDCRGLLTLN